MRPITLTRPDGSTIEVNPDHIGLVRLPGKYDHAKAKAVVFLDGQMQAVMETTTQINEALAQ